VGFGRLSANHGAGRGFGLRCGPGDARAGSASVVLALGASGLKAEKAMGKRRDWATEETTLSLASPTAADQQVPQMDSLQGHAREGHLIEEERRRAAPCACWSREAEERSWLLLV